MTLLHDTTSGGGGAVLVSRGRLLAVRAGVGVRHHPARMAHPLDARRAARHQSGANRSVERGQRLQYRRVAPDGARCCLVSRRPGRQRRGGALSDTHRRPGPLPGPLARPWRGPRRDVPHQSGGWFKPVRLGARHCLRRNGCRLPELLHRPVRPPTGPHIAAIYWPWSETDSTRVYSEKATLYAAEQRAISLTRSFIGQSASVLPWLTWNALAFPYLANDSGMNMIREVEYDLLPCSPG